MPRKGENIYKRKDGRWEGRFIKEYNIDRKALYGYVYGKTYNEVKQKLRKAKANEPSHSNNRSPSDEFDPLCHNAVGTVEETPDHPEKTVVRVVRSGYYFRDRVFRPADVIVAVKRNDMLLPNDAGIYRQLGFAYMDADKPGDALQAFYKATSCAPNESEFYYLRAMLFRNADMIDDALKEAKTAFTMTPADNSARFEYFFALYEDALRSVSYNRSSGKHLITNKVQLDYANKLLKDMASTIPEDSNKSKCTSAMDEIVKIVVDAESIKKAGLFSSKPGYQYNYDISNAETRSTGKH